MITKIIGSAGTGKTKMLENICEDIMDITDTKKIGYVSLARATISNMINRFIYKKNRKRKDFTYFRTIHSLCYLLLSQNGYKIDLIEGHLQEFMEETGIDLRNIQYLHEYMLSDETYNQFRQYCYSRANKQKWEDTPVSINWNNYKEKYNLLDFYDLIDLCIENHLIPSIDYLIVDEAQDITKQQWEYLNLIIPNCKEVYLAGDDDQSIYGFIGGNVIFKDIPSDYEEYQTTSYRVPENILQFALNFANHNIINRYNKEVHSIISGGDIYIINENELEDKITDEINNDCMIVSRCGYLLTEGSNIKEMLKNNNIIWYNPYSDDIRFNKFGKGIVFNAFDCIRKLMERKDVYKQLVLDMVEIMPSNIFFKRGAKKAIKAIDKDMFSIIDISEFLTDEAKRVILKEETSSIYNFLPEKYQPYFQYWMETIQGDAKKVKIGTIHSVKGGEADVVFLLTEIPKRVEEVIYTAEDRDNEYRVWYVGMTRARKKLYIVNGNRRNIIL